MKWIIFLTTIASLIIGLSVQATIIDIPGDYTTIQQGINASTDGDTVLVQPDVYVENIDFLGHSISVGSLFLTSGDTTYISQTIINGGASGSVVSFQNEEDSNALITGFTIRNGAAENGAGIYCFASSPSIVSNQIDSNYAYSFNGGQGGGIYLQAANPRIERNIIRGNYVSGPLGGYGGGIYCGSQTPVIKDNIIDGNTGDGYGGGIYCESSGATISGNIFTDNRGIFFGGGIYCKQANPVISNNIFDDNYARWADGGGIYCDESSPMILNNVFFQNNAGASGGGIYCYDFSNPTLLNCVFYYNEAYELPDIDYDELSNPDIAFCAVYGGWPGEGNIGDDPRLRDPWNGDFHLMSIDCGDQYDSPCIDTGFPDIIDNLLDCSWGLGTLLCDMGAYGGGDSATVDIDVPESGFPHQFAILENFPNPFNPATTISFSLSEQSDVRIDIYNILGQKVSTLFDGTQEAGNHAIIWQADNYPSGIYFAKMTTESRSESIKMVLSK